MVIATGRSANGTTNGMGLRNRIDRVLHDAVAPANWVEQDSARVWAPPVDLAETGDDYELYLDLPGVSPDRIDLTIDAGVLTVRGARHARHSANEVRYHRQERTFGQFMRSFTLPSAVDQEGIEATFDAGVLMVRIPKREEARSRRIAIGIPHTESND